MIKDHSGVVNPQHLKAGTVVPGSTMFDKMKGDDWEEFVFDREEPQDRSVDHPVPNMFNSSDFSLFLALVPNLSACSTSH
jgi:hypothetical protein